MKCGLRPSFAVARAGGAGWTCRVSKESTTAALLRFPAVEGDGPGPGRPLTPHFHALLNVVLQERMPEEPRLLAEYAKGIIPSRNWSPGSRKRTRCWRVLTRPLTGAVPGRGVADRAASGVASHHGLCADSDESF